MRELVAPFVAGTRQVSRLARWPTVERLALVTVFGAFVVLVAMSLSATPRRSGDAHQYIAMALQLSRLGPPSLSAGELSNYQTWLESQPPNSGFLEGARALRQPALILGGRQEFSHFWFYPLLVAPATAIGSAIGAHPLTAFTITNAALLGVALSATLRIFGSTAALLVIASPIIWFIARAQVEIFTIALLCLAMAAAASGRWGWASLAVAFASTQNVPIAAAIPLFWTAGIAEWMHDRRDTQLSRFPERTITARAIGLALASVGVALLHPGYYLLRLGVVTPQELNGGIAGTWPTADRYLAPLIDANLGFLVWMPATAVLTLFGLGIIATCTLRGESRNLRLTLTTLCGVGMAAWFLFVFAQTTNVNSGGTVHVSRYALWLLPLTLPAIATASRNLEVRTRGILLVPATVLFAAYLSYFHPDQAERYVEHSPQAAWLMAHVSDVYRPIPEVFVERTLHIDGGPYASAADPSCQLILVVANRPEQPCVLTATEQSDLVRQLDHGVDAVWVRRSAPGASSVEAAFTES